MIGAGMNTRDIAPQLGISPKTVATHRENIKLKLGLKDGRALLQSAMQWLEKPSR
jgi:DNA-binding CsgD family transcriptional regulator